ncbi:MAG: polysaccharide deacetylase [Eubacterium sp.]|nr:polysaccharide deacetylase [Eubacterium sp.]
MTGDTVGKISADYRRTRVKRIKRIIIFFIVFMILLPTCLSVYLIIRVNMLETELDRFVDSAMTAVSEEAEKTAQMQAEPEPAAVSGAAVSEGSAVLEDEDVLPGEGKKVYLTFDDGPGPGTEKILDILKKQGVYATFFVTGKTDDFSMQMYKRIVDDGHTLGMHSYSHVFDEIYSSEKAFSQDLDKLYEFLYDVNGVHSEFYRFPGGSSVDETSVPIENLIRILDEKGITYLDWNVLSPDIRDSGIRKKQMVSEILDDVSKYETSIVMFYDSGTQPMTIKALPAIIKRLKADGYELLPVDESTAPIRHNQ